MQEAQVGPGSSPGDPSPSGLRVTPPASGPTLRLPQAPRDHLPRVTVFGQLDGHRALDKGLFLLHLNTGELTF